MSNTSLHSDTPFCQQSQRVILTADERAIRFSKTIATGRRTGHDGRRKPGQDAGGRAANQAVDEIGVMAEILLANALQSAGIVFRGLDLLVTRPTCSPDFWIGRQSFDVKTIRENSSALFVNERQRLVFASKFPGCLYLPMQAIGQNAFLIYAPITAAMVATADLLTPERHPKIRADCRSIPLVSLRPLVSLTEL